MKHGVQQATSGEVLEVQQFDKLCAFGSWSSMQQITIDQAIQLYRVRLNACIQARIGHFEHLM